MGINPTEDPFLFSTGSLLAYEIAKNYYGNIHFVWCTTKFNSSKQPVTSNPFTICQRLLQQIKTGDRHAPEIKGNISGILMGAESKLSDGVITLKNYNEINQIVAMAKYEAFTPIVYIINSKRVKTKCIEVKVEDKASDSSIEYKITNLKQDEFQVIHFKDLLHDIVEITDKRVGE